MNAANDLSLYDRHANEWWDERGRFAGTLHGVNELRLQQIEQELGIDLRGLHIVDLGCGGGLMSEPLARRGATVVGVDISRASLSCARIHGASIPGLTYMAGDVRSPPLPPGSADVVLCADLLEHVENWPQVLTAAFTLLRPGGRCYCSTINRTWLAKFLAVTIAEGVGLIPRGTHDPQWFITPEELRSSAESAGFTGVQVLGQRVRLLSTLREWRIRVAPGASTRVAYSVWMRRP